MKSRIAIPALAFFAGALTWHLAAPLSAWAIGGGAHRVVAESEAKPLTPHEVKKVEAYMQQIFVNKTIRLVHVAPDAEVHLGEHFLGVVYPDDGREGRTFYFEMAIFEEEAGESPPSRRGR